MLANGIISRSIPSMSLTSRWSRRKKSFRTIALLSRRAYLSHGWLYSSSTSLDPTQRSPAGGCLSPPSQRGERHGAKRRGLDGWDALQLRPSCDLRGINDGIRVLEFVFNFSRRPCTNYFRACLPMMRAVRRGPRRHHRNGILQSGNRGSLEFSPTTVFLAAGRMGYQWASALGLPFFQ